MYFAKINTMADFSICKISIYKSIFGFQKEKFDLKIWGVTSWYQSLSLRDLDKLSGKSEVKLRTESFTKKK